MYKKILKLIPFFISLTLSFFLIYNAYSIGILPNKYIIILSVLLISLNIVSIICISVKNIISKMISVFISIILIFISIICLNYIKNTNEFLETSFENLEKELTTYKLLVLKDSEIQNVTELKNKKMGYLNTDEYWRDSIIIVCNVTVPKYNDYGYEDLFELYEDLLKNKIDAMLINENLIDTLYEEYDDIDIRTRVIYSFDIDKENESTYSNESTSEMSNENENSNIPRVATNEKVFNIFISGSDSRSSTIATKSRSDVNMVLTINRNTKTILLTSIPRDYYVQVHGQVGLKDKLTHAGIYGIDRSRQTVEDLLNINIDYAIKVNMNSVIEIVDLVGGIDIYSDLSFRTKSGVNVNKGWNYFNGKEALAYARERKAYAGGDRHRILNQQQVLEAVLKKIISDKSMLFKYDTLLNSLSNLYRTSIPKSLITEIVKEQLDSMSSWNFITQTVDGSNASRHTYIGPKYWRYVMIPYQNDLVRATTKINEVLS